MRRCLTESNGLYADHIGAHGRVEPAEWSYNQGAMIGAGTLLYQATHNGAFLYEARQTAKAALAYYTPERLGSENPFFVSVYFRNISTSTQSPTTRPVRSSPRPTSTTPGNACACPTTSSCSARPPPHSCSTRPRSCRSTACCLPPSTYFEGLRAQAADEPPGWALVQAPALAQGPLAQTRAPAGDRAQQLLARATVSSQRPVRRDQFAEHRQVVLIAEQFPEPVRAPGELGQALVRAALDVDRFQRVAQVLDLFAPLVHCPAGRLALGGELAAVAAGAVDVRQAGLDEPLCGASLAQPPPGHAHAQIFQFACDLLAGGGVTQRLRGRC